MQIYGNQGGKTYYWDSQRKINELFRREGNVCLQKIVGFHKVLYGALLKRKIMKFVRKIYIRSVQGWEFQ